MEFTPEILALLFGAALLAGFVDTLAGGGGLITLPALVVAGVPPLAALGTNKLQGSLGTATATLLLLKQQKLHWHSLRTPMLFAFGGALFGTLGIQLINTQALSFIIPLALSLIGLYFLLAPYLKLETQHPRISAALYQKTLVPLIGIYDGAFGPGTGSFFSLAGTSLCGLSVIQATAVAKPLNFATNIASLVVFIAAAQVLWLPGLIMVTGQILGAWLGTHCLYKISPALLRLLIVTLCSLMLVHYFTQ